MIKYLLLIPVWILTVGTCFADLRVAGIFGKNMVLQRERPVPVWGWAEPGEEVQVAFAGQTVTAKAGQTGKWTARLEPMKASVEPRDLTVRSTSDEQQQLTIANVLVGEVWLCSGQSNMEWPLTRAAQPKAEIAAADFPAIRHIKIGGNVSGVPLNDLKAQWQVCSPKTAAGFTAVGYFFARRLHSELEVPIGLIGSNWGGTKIEPWTSPAGFRQVPELKAISDALDVMDPSSVAGQAAYGKAIESIKAWLPGAEAAVNAGMAPKPLPMLPSAGGGRGAPARIYNARIHPLVPYAMRGALWYQGESNGGEGVTYYHKLQALIGGWRTLWGESFPFYIVQLPNFGGAHDRPGGGDGWAKLREAQMRAMGIENAGVIVTIDIGEPKDIHPKNKQDVGARLALWALAKEYGRDDLVYSGPLYKSHKVEGSAIRVEFDHTGGGLMVGKKSGLDPVVEDAEGSLKRFAIAGADKKWQWADVEIEGDTVVVSCAAILEPVAVRYAFSHNPEGCNLYNVEGLPAAPFRTDDW